MGASVVLSTRTQGTPCFNCPWVFLGSQKQGKGRKPAIPVTDLPWVEECCATAQSSISNQHACPSLSELQPVASLSLGGEEEGGSGSRTHSWEDLPSPGWADPSHGSPWHPALPPLTQMVSVSPCQASKIFPMCSSHPFQQTPCLAQRCSLSALISSLCLRDTSAVLGWRTAFQRLLLFCFLGEDSPHPPPSPPRIIPTVLRGIKREVEEPSNLA